jgi:outer membrane biosynthesis protein TonB
MSERNKNSKDQLSHFLRYRGNKMSDKERNAFERGLQKDPFAGEASEGFEEIEPGLAETDITELQKRLKERTSGKQKLLWYRIAASVAVLLILSSIFLIIERRKPSDQLAYSPAPPAAKEAPVIQEQEKTAEPVIRKEPVTIAPEKTKKVPVEVQKDEPKQEKKEEFGEAAISADNQVAAQIARAEEPDEAIAKGRALASKPELVKRTRGTFSMIKGRIISSEDNMPIPGASVTVKGTGKGTVTDTGGNFILAAEGARNKLLVAGFVGMESKEFKAVEDSSIEIKLQPSVSALNEIVVVGYGGKGIEKVRDDEVTGYTPPQPVYGRTSFNKYIQDNLRRPDTATSGQRVVVVLNFIVDMNGKIDSMKVIKSPGKIFSDEAIRLIKEGPSWKSAEQNGRAISDEVRIRIVFK